MIKLPRSNAAKAIRRPGVKANTATRMFVIGNGERIKFLVCVGWREARKVLGRKARMATDADVRDVWIHRELYKWPPIQLSRLYAVSRQAIDKWKVRAGKDVPRYLEWAKANGIPQVIDARKERLSATELGKLLGLSAKEARAAASVMKLKLKGYRRMPSDEELVELQKGRTWKELAEVTELKVATLRQYIYARPELAASMKAVRKPDVMGLKAQREGLRMKVAQMSKEGKSPVEIATKLGIEYMTARYWLKKLEAEHAKREQARLKREARNAVVGSNGGDQRDQG